MIRKFALLGVLLIPALAPAQKVHDSHRDRDADLNRASHGDHKGDAKHKREAVAVPEGGSTIAYFALSGAAAAAAVWVSRKRWRGEGH